MKTKLQKLAALEVKQWDKAQNQLGKLQNEMDKARPNFDVLLKLASSVEINIKKYVLANAAHEMLVILKSDKPATSPVKADF